MIIVLCQAHLCFRMYPSGSPLSDRSARGRITWSALIDRADAILDGWYARMGIWPGSMLIAAALSTLSFLYIGGGTEPISHGACYAALSEAPFDTSVSNPFRNRILAPLIGWVLQLRGPHFVFAPWLFLLGLLAMVNVWCKREGVSSLLALSITLSMAFSPVTLHSVALPGFIEAVSYFFLGVALWCVRYPVASCACMVLAVMAHEASVFMIPAWLVAGGGGPSRVYLRRMLLLGAMFVPYAAYRWWLVRYADEGLSASYYFSARNLEACLDVGPLATMVGAFGVFRLHWLVLLVALIQCGSRNARVRWSVLVFLSVTMSLIVAFDTTRMLCWTFPIMVAGAVELARIKGAKYAVALVMVAWILNFLIPPYTTSGAETHRLNGIREHAEESPLTSSCALSGLHHLNGAGPVGRVTFDRVG